MTEQKPPYKETGLVCQKCKQPIVQIVRERPFAAFDFRCPACGHTWSTDGLTTRKPEKPS